MTPRVARVIAVLWLSGAAVVLDVHAEPPNPPGEVVGPPVLPEMVELVQQLAPSTAFVLAVDDYGQVLQGSGVVVRPDGWVVTSFEVVSWTSRYEVQLLSDEGLRSFDARLVRTFPSLNLALLWIPATGLPTLRTAAGDHLHPGAPVIGLGYPAYNQLERGLRITRGRLGESEERDRGQPDEILTAELLYVSGLVGSAVCTPAGELVGLVIGAHPDHDRAVRVLMARELNRRVDAVAERYVVPLAIRP